MTCRAPPGFVCVSGLPFRIAVPESTAIIVPGQTTDALNGVRGISSSTVPTQSNYTVINTSARKAIVKNFRGLQSGQYGNSQFSGTFTVAPGSTVTGIPASTNIASVGTITDGVEIISVANPPTFKTFVASNAFNIASGANTVSLSLKSNPVLTNFTSSGTVSVGSNADLGTLAVQSNINVTGTLVFGGDTISGLNVSSLIPLAKTKGNIVTRNTTTTTAISVGPSGYSVSINDADNPAISYRPFVGKTLDTAIPQLSSVQAGYPIRVSSLSPIQVDKVVLTDGYPRYDPATNVLDNAPIGARFLSASLTSIGFTAGTPSRGIICTGSATLSQGVQLDAGARFGTGLPITTPTNSAVLGFRFRNASELILGDDRASAGTPTGLLAGFVAAAGIHLSGTARIRRQWITPLVTDDSPSTSLFQCIFTLDAIGTDNGFDTMATLGALPNTAGKTIYGTDNWLYNHLVMLANGTPCLLETGVNNRLLRKNTVTSWATPALASVLLTFYCPW
jgi:hypothetical protein